MYCRYCGEKIGENVRFCPKCGALVKQNNSPKGQQDTKDARHIARKRGILIPIIIVVIIAASLIIRHNLGSAGKGGNSIVGTWNSEDGEEVLIFDEDGTCSVPFTYDGGWWESCDRYSIDNEGTLILSSSKGNIDSERYTRQDSEEAVEENGGYYLSGDTLIFLDFRTIRSYTRQ